MLAVEDAIKIHLDLPR